MVQKISDPADTFYRQFAIARQHRERLNGHRSALLWFTGLPGSGKSTIANAVEQVLHAAGYCTFILDGDNVRRGLNNDLGFSDADRTENIRRIGEVARLFVNAGVITMCAVISPFRADRERMKNSFGDNDFIEIYCGCPPEICEQRDTKGLYAKARAGKLKDFTGVTSPYEIPRHPDLKLDTHQLTVHQNVELVVKHLQGKNIIRNIS